MPFPSAPYLPMDRKEAEPLLTGPLRLSSHYRRVAELVDRVRNTNQRVITKLQFNAGVQENALYCEGVSVGDCCGVADGCIDWLDVEAISLVGKTQF